MCPILLKGKPTVLRWKTCCGISQGTAITLSRIVELVNRSADWYDDLSDKVKQKPNDCLRYKFNGAVNMANSVMQNECNRSL